MSVKKYTDNMYEGYLDSEEKFWDYRTRNVTPTEIVDRYRTGISFYDAFLNPRNEQRLRTEDNLKGTIIMMSPEEYYYRCARHIFEVSINSLKEGRSRDTKTLEKLKTVLTLYKKQLCMPMINYAEKSQEGLHRMYVIGELYGWDYKVPVLVIEHADVDRARREAQKKIENEIYSRIRNSVDKALDYSYTSLQSLKEQLQWYLDSAFEYSTYVTTPVNFELLEKNEVYSVRIGNVEYEFEKEDLNLVEEEQDTSIDDSDYDSLDDVEIEEITQMLSKYDVEESFSESNSELEAFLESCVNTRGETNAVIMKRFCEEFPHLTYKGKTLYSEEEKVASIQTSKTEDGEYEMLGYKLF